MRIHEAVQKALEINGWIVREKLKNFGSFRIKPTNTAFCCIVGNPNSHSGVPRWNPSAEDLTATDWMVIDENDCEYLRN